jgi:hypothetical protein
MSITDGGRSGSPHGSSCDDPHEESKLLDHPHERPELLMTASAVTLPVAQRAVYLASLGSFSYGTNAKRLSTTTREVQW